MHERINTTKAKCMSLRPYAEKIMLNAVRVARTNSIQARQELQRYLTTTLARRKIVKEIAARMSRMSSLTLPWIKPEIDNATNTDEGQCHFTNLRFLTERRRGDTAKMAYIEFKGNQLENYEKSLEREKIEKGEIPDVKAFKEKIFKQERDFFAMKL